MLDASHGTAAGRGGTGTPHGAPGSRPRPDAYDAPASMSPSLPGIASPASSSCFVGSSATAAPSTFSSVGAGAAASTAAAAPLSFSLATPTSALPRVHSAAGAGSKLQSPQHEPPPSASSAVPAPTVGDREANVFALLRERESDDEDEAGEDDDGEGEASAAPACSEQEPSSSQAKAKKKRKKKKPKKRDDPQDGTAPAARPAASAKAALPLGFQSYITGVQLKSGFGYPPHHPSVEVVVYNYIIGSSYEQGGWAACFMMFERDGRLSPEGRAVRQRFLAWVRHEYELVEAVLEGDEDAVRWLLDPSRPLRSWPGLKDTTTTLSGERPLMYEAVRAGCSDGMLRLLCSAMPGQCDHPDHATGETALQLACKMRDRAKIRIMVEEGKGHVDSSHKDGDTALRRAVAAGDLDFALFLLSLGADPCARNHRLFQADEKSANTPLELAAQACDLVLLCAMHAALLRAKPRFDWAGLHPRRALAFACRAHRNAASADAVALLLGAGVPPNAASMEAAAESGSVEFVRLSWTGSRGAASPPLPPPTPSASPPPPVPTPAAAPPAPAAPSRSPSPPASPAKGLVKGFLGAKPKPPAAPLVPAAPSPPASPAKGLVKGFLGAKPTPGTSAAVPASSKKPERGPPPPEVANACLERALDKGPSHADLARFLVESWGARPTQAGAGLAGRLVKAKNGDLLAWLVERGLVDLPGEIAAAAAAADRAALAALLPHAAAAAGPRLVAVPLQALAEAGMAGEIARLAELGADLDGVAPERPCTALLCAAEKKQTETAKRLIDLGASVEVARPADGFTVLHIAAEKKDRELLKHVLALGARARPLLARRSKAGRTPREVCRDRQLQATLQEAEKRAAAPAKGKPEPSPKPSASPSNSAVLASPARRPASGIAEEEEKKEPPAVENRVDPSMARSALQHLLTKIEDDGSGIAPLPPIAIAVESTREQASPVPANAEEDDEDEGLWLEGLDRESLDVTVGQLLAGISEQAWEIDLTKDVYTTWRAAEDTEIKEAAMRKLYAIAKGYRSARMAKRLTIENSSIELYESYLPGGWRMLWEETVLFSQRSGTYRDGIRLWAICGHDEAQVRIRRIADGYRKSRPLVAKPPVSKPRPAARDADGKELKLPREFESREEAEAEVGGARGGVAGLIGGLVAAGAAGAASAAGEGGGVLVEGGAGAAAGAGREANVRIPVRQNDDSIALEKFYTLSAALAYSVLHDRGNLGNFWFSITETEHKIVSLDEPILLIGRSGTGKTACAVFRMWSRYRSYWDVSRGEELLASGHFRQVFVAASAGLCHEVRKCLEGLEKGHKLQRAVLETGDGAAAAAAAAAEGEQGRLGREDDELPDTLSRVQDDCFPLCVTSKKWLRLLDGTLDKPFFPRDAEGNVLLSRRSAGGQRGALLDDLNGTIGADIDEEEEEEEEFEGEWDGEDEGGADPNDDDGEQDFFPLEQVTYEAFCSSMWRGLCARVKDKEVQSLHPHIVYVEIQSHIKGSLEALETEEGHISLEAYSKMGDRRSRVSPEQRLVIYRLFQKYERMKRFRDMYDTLDVVHHIYRQIKRDGYRGPPIHNATVDEVQDFTQAELWLMFCICEDPKGLFFCGDTCQTIARGVGFRFCDLRSLFHKEAVVAGRKKSAHAGRAPVRQLTQNYRSHAKVLSLASLMIEMLEELFVSEIDVLEKDTGLFDGPDPILVEASEPEQLFVLLLGHERHEARVDFGADQAIIVRTEAAAEALPEELSGSIVLTVEQAKGLEFNDVLLYNFFKDSSADEKAWKEACRALLSVAGGGGRGAGGLASVDFERMEGGGQRAAASAFDQIKHKIIASELKYLYTAITRAKVNVWIYDADEAKRRPMFDLMKRRKLVKPASPADVVAGGMASHAAMGLAKSKMSSKKDWLEAGKRFMEKEVYGVAAMCFKKAGEGAMQSKALAHKAASTAKAIEEPVKKRQKYREAGDLFGTAGEPVLAAKCFYTAREFERAAKLYETAGKFYKAAFAYAIAKTHHRAAELYERAYAVDGVTKSIRLALRHFEQSRSYDDCLRLLQEHSILAVDEARPGARGVRYYAKLAANSARDRAARVRYMKLIGSPAEMEVFCRRHGYFEELVEYYDGIGERAKAAQLLVDLGDYFKAGKMLADGGEPALSATAAQYFLRAVESIPDEAVSGRREEALRALESADKALHDAANPGVTGPAVLLAELKTHNHVVSAVDVSKDGKLFATGDAPSLRGEGGHRVTRNTPNVEQEFSDAGHIRVWSGPSPHRLVHTWERAHGGRIVCCVRFSPDASKLASGGYDSHVRVWSVGMRTALFATHCDPGISRTPIYALEWTSDGSRIVAGVMDDIAVIDGVRGGVKHAEKGHNDSITSISISSDGDRAATGSDDGTAIVWSLRSYRRVAAIEDCRGHVSLVSLLPDNATLLTMADQGEMVEWSSRSGRQLSSAELLHDAAVAATDKAAVILAACAGNARAIEVYDRQQLKLLRRLEGHQDIISSLAMTPDGKLLISGSHDTTARVWGTPLPAPDQQRTTAFVAARVQLARALLDEAGDTAKRHQQLCAAYKAVSEAGQTSGGLVQAYRILAAREIVQLENRMRIVRTDRQSIDELGNFAAVSRSAAVAFAELAAGRTRPSDAQGGASVNAAMDYFQIKQFGVENSALGRCCVVRRSNRKLLALLGIGPDEVGALPDNPLDRTCVLVPADTAYTGLARWAADAYLAAAHVFRVALEALLEQTKPALAGSGFREACRCSRCVDGTCGLAPALYVQRYNALLRLVTLGQDATGASALMPVLQPDRQKGLQEFCEVGRFQRDLAAMLLSSCHHNLSCPALLALPRDKTPTARRIVDRIAERVVADMRSADWENQAAVSEAWHRLLFLGRPGLASDPLTKAVPRAMADLEKRLEQARLASGTAPASDAASPSPAPSLPVEELQRKLQATRQSLAGSSQWMEDRERGRLLPRVRMLQEAHEAILGGHFVLSMRTLAIYFQMTGRESEERRRPALASVAFELERALAMSLVAFRGGFGGVALPFSLARVLEAVPFPAWNGVMTFQANGYGRMAVQLEDLLQQVEELLKRASLAHEARGGGARCSGPWDRVLLVGLCAAIAFYRRPQRAQGSAGDVRPPSLPVCVRNFAVRVLQGYSKHASVVLRPLLADAMRSSSVGDLAFHLANRRQIGDGLAVVRFAGPADFHLAITTAGSQDFAADAIPALASVDLSSPAWRAGAGAPQQRPFQPSARPPQQAPPLQLQSNSQLQASVAAAGQPQQMQSAASPPLQLTALARQQPTTQPPVLVPAAIQPQQATPSLPPQPTVSTKQQPAPVQLPQPAQPPAQVQPCVPSSSVPAPALDPAQTQAQQAAQMQAYQLQYIQEQAQLAYQQQMQLVYQQQAHFAYQQQALQGQLAYPQMQALQVGMAYPDAAQAYAYQGDYGAQYEEEYLITYEDYAPETGSGNVGAFPMDFGGPEGAAYGGEWMNAGAEAAAPEGEQEAEAEAEAGAAAQGAPSLAAKVEEGIATQPDTCRVCPGVPANQPNHTSGSKTGHWDLFGQSRAFLDLCSKEGDAFLQRVRAVLQHAGQGMMDAADPGRQQLMADVCSRATALAERVEQIAAEAGMQRAWAAGAEHLRGAFAENGNSAWLLWAERTLGIQSPEMEAPAGEAAAGEQTVAAGGAGGASSGPAGAAGAGEVDAGAGAGLSQQQQQQQQQEEEEEAPRAPEAPAPAGSPAARPPLLRTLHSAIAADGPDAFDEEADDLALAGGGGHGDDEDGVGWEQETRPRRRRDARPRGAGGRGGGAGGGGAGGRGGRGGRGRGRAPLRQ
eukprot:tig00020960_g16564.t1